MDKMIKAYLARAVEIIGERTESEIRHDDSVVEALNQGHSIKDALAIAAARFPDEAIQLNDQNSEDVAAHYDYLKEHAKILKSLKRKKRM